MSNRKAYVAAAGLCCAAVLKTVSAVEAENTQLGGFEIEIGGKNEEFVAQPQDSGEKPQDNFSVPPPEDSETSIDSASEEKKEPSSFPQTSDTGENSDEQNLESSNRQVPESWRTETVGESYESREENQKNDKKMYDESKVQQTQRNSSTPKLTERLESEKEQEEYIQEEEKFLRQIQVQKGEMSVQLSFRSSQDWYLYSFQVNGKEIYYHWENSWCTGEDIPWQEGENQVDAVVRTGDGRFHDMEPWIILRQKRVE